MSDLTDVQIPQAAIAEVGSDGYSAVTREYGISDATFYTWKSKYGGISTSDVRRLKDLEGENQRLKRMFADLSLKHEALKDIVEKKL